MFKVRVRYRSLYWRIAIGFIFCIATVLVLQGAVLLWLLSQNDPDQAAFTQHLAAEVGEQLADEPNLDVPSFVNGHHPAPLQSFYVVMKSGRAFSFGKRRPPDTAIETVVEELQHEGLKSIPQFWQRSPYWASPILIDGQLNGIVSMVPRDTVAELEGPMAALALALVVVGTGLAARFIFGPAHRRLRALEATARNLGAGDENARAAEDGGDEVASLARTFNVMASDLAARAAQLAEFDRTRRLLLADISHELITPLTAIRGYQEKLSTDPAISESHQRRRFVGIIGEEALRVERIVRDLLDLARFESGAGDLDIQDVSIEGLFGRVAARHDTEAAARGVQLSTTIEPGAEIVRGDQFRLEQVLQNLAANALRHVPRGGRVELQAHLSRQDIVLTVRDSGTGVAKEHLPFIFNRFYKADASRAGVDGSGLGLSIVKAIVERHGGVVTVASQPDVETVFTITLPAGADQVLRQRSA